MAFNNAPRYYGTSAGGPRTAPLQSPKEYSQEQNASNASMHYGSFNDDPYYQQTPNASMQENKSRPQRLLQQPVNNQHIQNFQLRTRTEPQAVHEAQHYDQIASPHDFNVSHATQRHQPPEEYGVAPRNTYNSQPASMQRPSAKPMMGQGSEASYTDPNRYQGRKEVRPVLNRPRSDDRAHHARRDQAPQAFSPVRGHENIRINGTTSEMSQHRDVRYKKPERRTKEPPSPNTISWDNPFPTFPTKKKAARSDGGNSRPQTAGSSKSHDSSNSHEMQQSAGKRSEDRSRRNFDNGATALDNVSHKHPAGLPVPSHGRTRPSNWEENARTTQYSQDIITSSELEHTNQPSQRNQYRQLSEDPYSRVSPPATNYFTSPRRTNTMPTEASDPMNYVDAPQGVPAGNYRRERTSQDQNYREREHEQGRGQSTQPLGIRENAHSKQERYQNQGIPYAKGQDEVFEGQLQHSRQGSYDNVFDSYYDENTAPQIYHSARGVARTPREEDMPNFDGNPSNRMETDRGMVGNEQLHLKPLTSKPPTMQSEGSRGRCNDSGRANGFAGQAHRSRSQPNMRAGQPRVQNSHGFDFGDVAGSQPSYPGNPHGWADDNRPPQRQLLDHTPSHDQHYPRQPERRYMTDSQRLYEPQSYPQQPRYGSPGPQKGQGYSAARIRTQEVGPVSENRSGPMSPVSDRTPVNFSRGIIPQAGPSPIAQNNPARPPPGHPANPDALPEHPTPLRPGFMQAPANTSDARSAPVRPGNAQDPPHAQAKPPPVRQYDNGPSALPPADVTQPTANKATSERSIPKPVTHDELRRLRQIVQANPNDREKQLMLAKRLAEAASVLVNESGTVDQKTQNKNRERFNLEALKLVKKLVTNRYSEAVFYLADCHGRGLLGLQNDVKEAFSLYVTAAQARHPQAAYRVAVCCEIGLEEGGGTRRDPLKATQWYKRAAQLGDTPAMYKIGMIQLKGLLGQPKSPKEAISWLKKAAERADEENPHALHELGLLYEGTSSSDGIEQDLVYAKQLFTQAAELGYKFSQFRLGCAYEYNQLGCPISPRQSIAWYSKAAVQEEHQSELALSGWYLTGSDGVLQQSDTEAYLWARKAAQAGLAKAEYAMGYFSEVGIGAPANMEDAKRWYWRAASQNYPKARERLEDLRKGGATKQKSRVSRSAVNKQSEGDCVVM